MLFKQYASDRAGARLFRALGEIVHLEPLYHKNMTSWKFFCNFYTQYFFQQKLSPSFPLVTTTLISFTPLFGHFCAPPPLPCALGDRLVGLMVALGLASDQSKYDSYSRFTAYTVFRRTTISYQHPLI